MKKQINKKLLMFVLPVLLIGLITATAVYYAIFSASFTVTPAISLEGNLEQSLGDVISGELYEGDPITITNDAPSERTITFTDETSCDIQTSYATTLELNKKDSTWEIIPGTTVGLSYTFIGNEFKYKVDTELDNYVVVYYPDLDGNPGSWNIANAQLVGNANTEWTSSSVGYLPVETDWNDKAKLWLIPEADWIAQSWNPDDWYFENNLITYGEDITLDAESNIVVTPLYEVGAYESGECTITTTIA